MAAISDERALATWLASLDDASLRRLLAARGVPAAATWRGFFDAAESLLEEASVERALARLPRTGLSALKDRSEMSAVTRRLLQDLALIDPGGLAYAVVSARAEAGARADPAAFAAPRLHTAGPRADRATAAAAAERALTATVALAELILAARDGAVTTTASGTVAATDRKRLVEDGIGADGPELEDLLAAGRDAQLVRLVDREWDVAEAGDDWLPQAPVDRWSQVAAGFRACLPQGLRTPGGGYIPVAAWAESYPLDPEWPAQATALTRRAVRWGILGADGSEPEWGRALRDGEDFDPRALAPLLPAEIDRVYLQADLSAIAPGPLRSVLDLRLRTMAERESRAQASSYRFSAASLGRAVAAGETAASIEEFLSALSLTGIPQPLAYLLDQAQRDSGRIRVRRDAVTARTRVDVDDADLRETIAVDRGLRAVGLVSDGDALVSRADRDQVYWSLVDARYPAVAVDESGAVVSLRRRPAARSDPTDHDDYDALTQTLRAASAADTDAAWLERELHQAVRARAVIDIAVLLPGGAERSFTLEATGLGGGRLRGRDHAADVERTLPVSSIVSVRPAS